MTASASPKTARPAWLGASLRRAFWEVAVFVAIAILNPFSVVDWSEMRSHDFWQRINADNYPSSALSATKGAPRSRPGRDAITLVYFDDASVKRQYGAAPLNAQALLDLIDDIYYAARDGHRPRAIFVDMVLQDAAPPGVTADTLVRDALPGSAYAHQCDLGPATKGAAPASPFRCMVIGVAQLTHYAQWQGQPLCQESTLAKIDCIRKAGGVPLMFADVATQLEQDRPFGDRAGDQSPSAAAKALDEVAILTPATIDLEAYPLVTRDPAKVYDHPLLYPAAALYAAWCWPDRCKPSPFYVGADRQWAWSARFRKPLEVAWGVGPAMAGASPEGFGVLIDRAQSRPAAAGPGKQEECRPAEAGRWGDVKHLLRMAFQGLLKDRSRPCLYQRAVPSDIFQSSSLGRDDADRLVSDKLVIVGAQFQASTDNVAAAPFGAVPGVYLHAMALDNLIESGPRYQAHAQPIVGGFNSNDILNVGVLFVVAFLLARARFQLKAIEQAEHDGKPLPHPLLRQFGVIGAAALAVLLFWILLLALIRLPLLGVRIIPDNINAAAAMVVALLGLGELVTEALKPLLAPIGKRLLLSVPTLVRGATAAAEPAAAARAAEPPEPSNPTSRKRGKKT